MAKEIFKLYQDGKLILTGTKDFLVKKTKLKMSTINDYCRPGYLESKKNETKTKVIKVKDKNK